METRLGRMQALVRSVREVRNRYMVAPATPLDVSVRCAAALAEDFRTLAPFIASLGGVRQFKRRSISDHRFRRQLLDLIR